MRSTFDSRRASLWLCVAVASLASGCGLNRAIWIGGEYNSTAHKTEGGAIGGNVKMISVENQFGAVRIIAATDASYHWSWGLTVHAETDAEARDGLTLARLQIETNGDALHVVLILPKSDRHRQYGSDIELRAPKSIAVEARNHFGPVEVGGVDGPVFAESQSGSVEARDISGKVNARTSFSSLRVENVGPATLRNQSGEIVAGQIHGDLEAETSFARLEATDIGGNLKAQNQSGAIEAARVAGRADLKTSFSGLIATEIHGPLTVKNQSGSIKAESISGDCELETSFSALSASGISGDARLRNQSGSITVRDVKGAVSADTSFSALQVEGAGKSFVCHNQSGSIEVRARSADLTKLEAKTSFGAINIDLPAGINRPISAHTTFGDVTSDFPVTIKGAVGDIALEDQSGSIRIHRGAE